MIEPVDERGRSRRARRIGAVAALAAGTVAVVRRRASRARLETELEVARDLAARLEIDNARLRRGEPERTHGDHRSERDAAETLDLQRSALLRSVSHDLRTPLASIRVIVSDLYGGTAYDDDTRKMLLRTVLDEVARLDRLVGNVLAYGRLEAGAMTPRLASVEVAELVGHRAHQLAPLLRDHEVVIDVPDDLPAVLADYDQMEQVLTNLLGNAARHAPPGSAVEIRAAAEPPGAVRISVVDHGPGFDPEVRGRLFEPFVRGAGARSTGLGLAICRSILDAHGGEVAATDTPGGGATVSFTLPVAPESSLPPEPGAGAP